MNQSPQEAWVATEATVTTCKYQFAGLSNLAFGFSTQKRFRITFDYYAHGRLYSGQFQSPTAIPQNQGIRITYNPLHPEQNSRDSSTLNPSSSTKPPIIAVGIVGSILLSLAWLLILRSCH